MSDDDLDDFRRSLEQRDEIHEAFDVVLARMGEKADPSSLDPPMRTFAMVYAAHGVIENGGLQYFFESNWAGTPPYADFADAYRAIGAHESAEIIMEAVALFPFENPELYHDKRDPVLESHRGQLMELSERIWDDGVWDKLRAYLHDHRHAFGI